MPDQRKMREILKKGPKKGPKLLGGAVDPDDYKRPAHNRPAKKRMNSAAAKVLANPGQFGGGTTVIPKDKPKAKPPVPTRKPKKASAPKRKAAPRKAKREGFDFAGAIARGFGGSSAWSREKKKAGVRD